MYKHLIKIVLLIILMIMSVSSVSCSKKSQESSTSQDESFFPERENVEAQNDEQITVEQAISKALDKLSISTKTIKKIVKNDGIYFYIPIPTAKDIDLDFADMVLTGQLEITGTQIANVIREEKVKVIREYYDPIHKQSYIIEIYNDTAEPGFYPEERSSNIAYLAVIIQGFGSYDNALLDEFANSDQAITFAIIPGLAHSKSVMQKALSNGHEVIIQIPMQADNPKANPGKDAITEKMSANEIKEKMANYFKELNHAVGATQYMGSKISSNKDLMNPVLSYLQDHSLFFIDNKLTTRSIAYQTALEMNIPSGERDLFLDLPANSDEVLQQRLNELRKLKDSKGKALIITHCHDKSRLDRLTQLIKEAEKMGYELIPVSKYIATEPEL